MNSQQELLEAINTISQNRDRSFDTPATVLRVEGDTVWVHIDGGADETPVQKTINCSEGETVQVRISNGSAFLVGNASAPPTDDKTANVAHFVAEQADEKATEAIKSVNAIEQTVEGKVDSGDSNITDISSTMYQDAYGVNIFNGTLAVGDSYAHIDGDSFDIKEVTTAGGIDDTNDPVVASFGATESVIKSSDSSYMSKLVLSSAELTITKESIGDPFTASGWEITPDRIKSTGAVDTYQIIIDKTSPRIFLCRANTSQARLETEIKNSVITIENLDRETKTSILPNILHVSDDRYNRQVLLSAGDISLTGDVYALENVGGSWEKTYKKTPTILESSSISASTTTYTFTDSAITADSTVEVFDEIDGFEYTTCSASAGSCTITFPAQSTSHKIKLHVW